MRNIVKQNMQKKSNNYNSNNNGLKDGQMTDWEKKRQWDIQHLPWATIPGMDRWEILILALIDNVNQSNEKYITLIHVCISIKSQHSIRQVALTRTATSLV